jgi:2-oxoglutarate ferredoxin oxidoreductase subunit beta
VNNGIYGMTGGQMAPTTPRDLRTVTSPYGNIESLFDISGLVIAAGASFVARWTTYHARQITNTMKKAIQHRGFAFIEIISQCPVQFGRRTGMGNATSMMGQYRANSVPVQRAREMSPEDLAGKLVVGEMLDVQKPEFTQEMEKLIRRVQEAA